MHPLFNLSHTIPGFEPRVLFFPGARNDVRAIKHFADNLPANMLILADMHLPDYTVMLDKMQEAGFELVKEEALEGMQPFEGRLQNYRTRNNLTTPLTGWHFRYQNGKDLLVYYVVGKGEEVYFALCDAGVSIHYLVLKSQKILNSFENADYSSRFFHRAEMLGVLPESLLTFENRFEERVQHKGSSPWVFTTQMGEWSEYRSSYKKRHSQERPFARQLALIRTLQEGMDMLTEQERGFLSDYLSEFRHYRHERYHIGEMELQSLMERYANYEFEEFATKLLEYCYNQNAYFLTGSICGYLYGLRCTNPGVKAILEKGIWDTSKSNRLRERFAWVYFYTFREGAVLFFNTQLAQFIAENAENTEIVGEMLGKIHWLEREEAMEKERILPIVHNYIAQHPEVLKHLYSSAREYLNIEKENDGV